MSGIKLNLVDSILIKDKANYFWEAKGRSDSGVNFSWQSPLVITIDVSISQTTDLLIAHSFEAASILVDMGDGTTYELTSGTLLQHTYSQSSGLFDITIKPETKTVLSSLSSFGDQYTKIKSFGSYSPPLVAINSSNMASVPPELPTRKKSLGNAFSDCTSLNDGNISLWNTSNIESMAFLFFNASAFNQNLGPWDIGKVTNMEGMFNNSGLSTENYSRILIGWANQHFAGNAQNNVPLGAANITYNSTAYTTGGQFNDAVSARAYLVNTAGWTISDGGQV